jgi:hypothetical protein
MRGNVVKTQIESFTSLGGEHSVVTTNANDSRPRENRSNEARNNNFRPRVNRDDDKRNEGRPFNNGNGNRESRPYNKDAKPYDRESRPYNKEARPYNKDAKPYDRESRPYNKEARPYNKESRPSRPYNKDGAIFELSGNYQRDNDGFKGRDAKSGSYNGYNKDRNFNKDRDFDKDKNDGRTNRSYGSKDQRMKDTSSKEKEQQPDKFETIKRLEKEKKVIQKKQESKKTEKVVKPQVKQKRAKSIDWTRGYQNGLYNDDDEDYTMFV